MAPTQNNSIVITVLKELIAGIRGISDSIREAIASGLGSTMKGNLREAQDLVPDIVRADALTFTATIGNAGITAPAAQIRVNPDYDFQLTGIRAFYEIPDPAGATDPQDIVRTTFQMREAGRSSDFFTVPLNLGALIRFDGTSTPMVWGEHGTYIFRAGAEIQPTFAVTAAHTHAARTWGVVLEGVLIRKRKDS